jgi:hypothetical protein
LADLLSYSSKYFLGEPRSVLHAASIPIRPLIDNILDELVDEVAVCAVHFYAIESCFVDGVGGGRGVQLNVLLDFDDAQFTWDDGSLRVLSGGRRDVRQGGVFGGEVVWERCASDGPQLQKDV